MTVIGLTLTRLRGRSFLQCTRCISARLIPNNRACQALLSATATSRPLIFTQLPPSTSYTRVLPILYNRIYYCHGADRVLRSRVYQRPSRWLRAVRHYAYGTATPATARAYTRKKLRTGATVGNLEGGAANPGEGSGDQTTNDAVSVATATRRFPRTVDSRLFHLFPCHTNSGSLRKLQHLVFGVCMCVGRSGSQQRLVPVRLQPLRSKLHFSCSFSRGLSTKGTLH